MDIKALSRIERLNYVLGGVVVAAGAVLFDRSMALGVLVGAVLSCLNFTVMRWLIGRAMKAAPGQRGQRAFFMLPKMAALMGLVFLAVKFLPIEAVGLILGFSIFLVSIAVETVRVVTNPPPSEGADDSK